MISKRLYRTDFYLKSNTAKVTNLKEIDGFNSVVCDQSVFFPTGGGQPSDVGTISINGKIFNVISATDDGLESNVWHLTDAPAGTFKINDEVELTIDWDNRFQNMQRHLGEHLLSGTFHNLFGGVNKGFHMGEDYITIDIDLNGEMLSQEELDLAGRTVNEAIWANLPVVVEEFDDYEKSKIRPVRKDVFHDGKVTVVTVGDSTEPYDCIACCGTHPDSTGQVGLIAIYKCESNKGMNRIYFDCGRKAWEYLNSTLRQASLCAARLSCGVNDLAGRIEAAEAEMKVLKGEAAEMSGYIKEIELSNIKELLSQKDNVCYEFDLIKIDDLLKLGFAAIKEFSNKFLILSHPKTKTALLFSSGNIDCNKIVKENTTRFNAKGGGKSDNARMVFQNEKDMKEFYLLFE